jgi:hypothetical protein
MRWMVTSSSVTGRSHADRGEPGQDCCRADTVQFGENVFFIGIAADGAGSTTDGGRGAEIACGTACRCIADTLGRLRDPALITDQEIQDWVAEVRAVIEAEAGGAGKRPKDYACTLVGAIAGEGHALFFQIGDGAIVIRERDGPEYETIFWPEQGEYANTTFFVTDETFPEHLSIVHRDTAPEEIALFTDGLQNLVLSFSKKKAHDGFFRPLFSALKVQPAGGFADFSRQLESFLLREDISARSDDDKTLILAVHLPG